MIVIYSKPNCGYCVRAKHLLQLKEQKFTEYVIGESLTKEAFIGMFPEVRTVPLIIIDGVKIGGYDQLKQWFATDGPE